MVVLNLKDIVAGENGLTKKLAEHDFWECGHYKGEKIRYEVLCSPISFQVGMHEDLDSPIAPDCVTIRVEFNHALPKRFQSLHITNSKRNTPEFFPDTETLNEFLSAYQVRCHGLVLDSDEPATGTEQMKYFLCFDKTCTKPERAVRALYELITRVHNDILNGASALSKKMKREDYYSRRLNELGVV